MCLSKVLIWSSFYHKWNISHLNELILRFKFLCFCKHQKSAHLYLYDNKTLNKRSFLQRKILYVNPCVPMADMIESDVKRYC